MDQPTHVDATFYAQVSPTYSPWHKVNGEPKLESAKVVAITQGKPNKQQSGTVLVKLTIRLPGSAFLPLRPEAVIVVPENKILGQPITVEAEDPEVEKAIKSIITGAAS